MYEPILNSVLVQIDDKEGEWGGGNDDSMLGRSYSKGTVAAVGELFSTNDHNLPNHVDVISALDNLKGRKIMWNEGTEAGTTFEFDGRLFGMIYWWDIRGVLVGK